MLRLAFYLLAANLCLTALPSCQAQTASSNSVPPPKKTSRGIFGIEFSRDGKTLVTAKFNGTVKLWDMASGRCGLWVATRISFIRGLLSPDEKFVASCSRDGKIKFFEISQPDV